jgi:hypothetical protein
MGSIFKVEVWSKKRSMWQADRLLLVGFWLDLLFVSEDGGDIFLRNARFSSNYTALQPKGQYSS